MELEQKVADIRQDADIGQQEMEDNQQKVNNNVLNYGIWEMNNENHIDLLKTIASAVNIA